MNHTINSIIRLLSENQKKNSIVFLFLLICSTILDGISIAMIFPVLKIITDQNYLVNLNEKILFIDLLQFDYEKIIFISIIAVVSIYIIKSFYMIFFSYWKSYFIVRMNNDISKRLFKKYIFSPYSYFFEKNSSEFLRNIYSESRYINQAVDNSFKLLIELFFNCYNFNCPFFI